MSDVNTDAPQTDAGRIAATLQALSDVLGNSALGAKTGDVTKLQRRVAEVLTVLNTNQNLIAGINAADTFGTDPSLALQRARLTLRDRGRKDRLPVRDLATACATHDGHARAGEGSRSR